MKLQGYFRSSAAYRARIALNLKGLLVRFGDLAKAAEAFARAAPEFQPDAL